MPDRDIFSRYAAPGWHTPMKCFYVSADPDEVARATLRSVAQTLRRRGGLAPLAELAEIVRNHDEGRTTALRALARVQAIQADQQFDLHVRIAAVTVSRMIAERYSGGDPFSQPAQELAGRFIRDLISHHVFERGRPELMVQRFGQDESLRASFEGRCWEAIVAGGRLEKLSAQLVRDPSGASIRLPASPSAPRITTGDWLAQSVT